MFSKVAGRLLPACLAVVLTGGVFAAHASQYDFVSVGTGTGFNNYSTGLGGNFGEITTIDLSGGFTSRSASYSIASFTTLSGTWALQSASGNLFGTFTTTSDQFYNPIFQRFVSTSTITGGTGTFLSATGSGTSEMILYNTCCSPKPSSSPYNSVVVDRLHVILPGSVVLDQGDTNGASVLIKTGVEDSILQMGHNEGPIISTSPSALPPLTYETADYSLVWPSGPPFIGTFVDTGASGDTLQGHSRSDILISNVGGFTYGMGEGSFDSGTGAYKDVTGRSRFEVFSVGLGTQDGIHYNYAAIEVARNINAVPEPETVVLMLAGLAFVGFCGRKKVYPRTA